MKTRAVRIPLSIKIATGAFGVALALKLINIANNALGGEASPLDALLACGLDLILITYQLATLPRLSRWAPIVQGAAIMLLIAVRSLLEPHWDAYPILGPFVHIIPLAVYLALVLPHWRKMNWAPLGLPYRPAETT